MKYVIRGIILDDETKLPATKCFIKLDFNGHGVWSDEFGRFKLNIPKYFLKDTLHISVNGTYKKQFYKKFTVLKEELPTNRTI